MLPEQAGRSMPCVDFCNACDTGAASCSDYRIQQRIARDCNVFWNISMQGCSAAAAAMMGGRVREVSAVPPDVPGGTARRGYSYRC